MNHDGRTWIAQLPDELDGQRAILSRLLSLCEANEGVRWLVVGCSVGRGAGDGLSDLDVAVGVREAGFPAIAADVRRGVDHLGDLVDSFQHQIPGVTMTHERVFAQFANRCQVDLVVFPTSMDAGAIPDVVVLYDPDDQIVIAGEPRPAIMPEQVREWAFLGWCALADLGKYLRRGSPWEALARLNEAREQLCRLWAAALDVRTPQYGLTSILDFAPGELPAGLEATVADLDPARLLSAGQALAALLSDVGRQLRADPAAALPEAMARYIVADLASIAPPAAPPARLCPHRQAYLDAMGLWGAPPGAPGGASPANADGRLAPGPDGADREAAFRGWHLVTRGEEHADPCVATRP
ncbi:MAG TPA: hypothetical protein VMV07_04320 [Streptosporangiaceae bacterium]|nr:hypothetical protein [Streptosporangiaceae bacterium]